MNICDKCKNYYPNNHYCQYWDCNVTIQHEMCCGFANMTNADHIRAMGDEELANFLTDFSNNGGWTTEIVRKVCYKTIADWLQQPKETKHGCDFAKTMGFSDCDKCPIDCDIRQTPKEEHHAE